MGKRKIKLEKAPLRYLGNKETQGREIV